VPWALRRLDVVTLHPEGDGVIIVGVRIRRRRIARRKRSFDRLVKSGFPDLSFLFGRVLMPIRLV
jgi:hypothetical protein